jgi:hypothetical protein
MLRRSCLLLDYRSVKLRMRLLLRVRLVDACIARLSLNQTLIWIVAIAVCVATVEVILVFGTQWT